MDTYPIVSILIPNFNNGRDSSQGGRRDLLGDLFESLLETLVDDPTPLEIIVADDGSTDDSLETCRRWAGRPWPGGSRRGQPFCRLMELEHCGVLSVVANRLTEAARGAVCCRLDGDIVVHTPRWAEIVAATFRDGPPDLGVIGPKQLGTDGRVHAAGSWILHPRGHHHIGNGADPRLLKRSREVDHVMGCFYCHRREIWKRLEGYDVEILRGQTVDFGLRSRLHGWRSWFVPTIEYTHYHGERAVRANKADSREGIDAALEQFAVKWGFDRLAPDLDEVARRYGGTPLLWNASVFGPTAISPTPARAPIAPGESEWGRYAEDERFRDAVNARRDVGRDAVRLAGGRRRVLVVGCGAGLVCHLLAKEGLEVIGVDADPRRVQLGREMTAGQEYPRHAPRLRRQRERAGLPVSDGSMDIVLAMDVLERHHNPVGLLQETHRVLGPDGVLGVVTRRRGAPLDDDPASGYRAAELVLQIQSTHLFRPDADEQVPAVPGALVVFGHRLKRRTDARQEALTADANGKWLLAIG